MLNRRLRWAGPLVLVLVLGWLWTATDAAKAETIDLTAAFSAATLHQETREIEFGAPRANPALISGFYLDIKQRKQKLIWSRGDRSQIQLIFADRRPRQITIRCKPLAYPDAPLLVLSFWLNDTQVATHQLARKMQTIEIKIPVGEQRIGLNRLEIRYSDVNQPAQVLAGNTDTRNVALAWDWLRVSSEGGPKRLNVESPTPFVDQEKNRRRLVLPRGSLVTYYARLRPGASLKISSLEGLDAARKPSGKKPEFSLLVETDEDGTLLDTLLDDTDVREPITLPVSGERIARLVFSAGGSDQQGALVIENPRLEEPNPTPLQARNTRTEAGPGAGGVASSEIHALRTTRANVVLCVIDTLRADHLGAYGNEVPVSPHFDRLAAEGVLFENALAVSSWTRPTVVSMLTGLRPLRHGAVGRSDRLAPEANTLAERLQAAGYRTGGFITNANVGVEFGVDQGFDVFEWYPHFKDRPNHRLRSTVQASESALQWIGKPGDEAPFFAYLHIMDPHGPYMPPKRERQQFAADVSDKEIGTGRHLKKLVALSIPVTESLRRDLSALYLAEIAYTDARLGDFLMRLDELGHREDTLVVVVSDHGEEIFDHGWSEHGKTLYAEQIHVPLVMRLPQGQLAGQRVEVAVEQIDLMPTILDLLGLLDLGIQNTIDGHSLLPLLSGQDENPFVPTFATLAMDGRRMWSVTEGDLKLIETYEYAHPRSFHPGLQLFDLSKDPGEQVNLAAERPVAVAYLRAKYKAAQHQSSARLQPEKAILSDAVEEELRALGYLE